MTFRHVVLLRWQDDTAQAAQDAVVVGLRGLPGQIDAIRSYNVGTDARVDDANYDVVVVADFDDADGYVAYRDHPAHRRVIDERIVPIVADRAAIQYQVD